MNIIVTSAPAVEPVSLEEIYLFMRMDPEGSPPTHPDDPMLLTMITSAREKVEQSTRRALVQQSIRLVLPCFPARRIYGPQGSWGYDDLYTDVDSPIELLRPPFQSIQSIRYYDHANVLQTLASDTYFVSEEAFVPAVRPANGNTWPITYRREDAVLVDYTVGYVPEGSPPDAAGWRANVPGSLRDAVKFEVQLQYDELAPEKRKDIQETIARLERSFVIPKF